MQFEIAFMKFSYAIMILCYSNFIRRETVIRGTLSMYNYFDNLKKILCSQNF
jgi:hypothetical protein